MLRHRIAATLALATLLLLGRGAVAFANANAYWNPAFNDPARVDITDISDLITKTILHSDPMDDVRRALLVVFRPTGRVVLASVSTADDASPRAHRPRAPPAV
ncbi:MAG TPA: hypothetical protein VGM22_07575 [Methylomirabilota bacterium]|jgi:hypothetical protein